MFETESEPNQNNQEETEESTLKSLDPLNKVSQDFDQIFNNIVESLNSYDLHSQKLQNIEIQDLSKQLKKQDKSNIEDESIEDDINHLLNASSNDILSSVSDISVPSERKKRYDFYEEIPNVNYIAFRMMKVYISNLLVANTQTKRILNTKENSFNNEYLSSIDKNVKKHYMNFYKATVMYYDLERKLKTSIVPDMLKHGNVFIEVINTSSVLDISSKSSLITESEITGIEKKSNDMGYCLFESTFSEQDDVLDETSDEDFKFNNFIFSNTAETIEENSYFDFEDDNQLNEFSFEKIQDVDFNKMSNILINTISARKVIIVQHNSIQYGYLVIDGVDSDEAEEVDIFKRFTQQENSSGNYSSEKEISKDIVDKMSKGIINRMNNIINRSSGNTSKEHALDLSESLETSIKSILYNKIKEKSKLKFRFLKNQDLVNFSTNIDKYTPYGTSVYDPIIQPVKMYTLALISSIISRLSRASVIRKWTVEAGNKKNHNTLIQTLKQDLSNKGISYDSLSNIKNISQVLTDFRDIATVSVKGNRVVDMEIMPMGDRSLPLNDMQELRSELIAATGIPSVYLNIGDQVDLRETLVNLNTSFANTISDLQNGIELSISDLTDNVFSNILEMNGFKGTFKISNYFKLTLNAPLVLQVQADEALVSSVSNMIGMIKGVGVEVDPVELYKLYVPQLDWDSLRSNGKAFIKELAKDQLLQDTSGVEQQ